MNKVYIIEKKYLKTLYLSEQEIILEEISDSCSLYDNIIKIYSSEELELKEDEIYQPFRLIAGDKDFNKEVQKMQCKYIEKITNFKNVTSVIEKKEANYYLIFYTNSLLLYIKNFHKERLTTHLNDFKNKDKYYGHGKTAEIKLREAGNNFKSLAEIHYGSEKLDKKTQKDLNKKEIISTRDLNKYLDLKEEDNFYQYQDLEDIKNILRIENNLLPSHKLLKTDKFLLLQINQEGKIMKNITEHNEALANNELLYSDNNMLNGKSKLFYSQAQKHDKSIFNDQEKAICLFLSFKLQDMEAILVSEKEQWVVYHRENINNLKDFDCHEEIIKILKERDIATDKLNNLSLKELSNLFIHNNELILSNENNIIYLDNNGKNLPLHIIINSGLHHHGYYNNGIWKSIIDKEDYSPVLPDLVNFSFSQIDNEDHVEVSVEYDGRKRVISDFFYLPAKYYDMMNSQLKKIFSYGLMIKPFDIVRWHKEKKLDIETIFMPTWISNVPSKKERELFKFLLQF